MSKSHLIYAIFKFHEALFNTQPLGFVKITFFSKVKGRIQRPPDQAALNIFGTLLHAVKMPDISVCGRQGAWLLLWGLDWEGRAAAGQWRTSKPELGLGCVRAAQEPLPPASGAVIGSSIRGLARAAFPQTHEDPSQPLPRSLKPWGDCRHAGRSHISREGCACWLLRGGVGVPFVGQQESGACLRL